MGRSYPANFYEPIKNSRVRESLQQIAQETEEDYLNLESVLRSFGVKVNRPDLDPDISILDFVDANGAIHYNQAKSCTLIPRPPMQPRDSFLVIGDRILATNHQVQSYDSVLCDYDVIDPWKDTRLDPSQQFDAPLATVIGDRIILDCREHSWLHDYFQATFDDYRIIPVHIGGHNDAVYAPVRPGVLISTYHHSNYSETFPGWTVKFIENQSWNAIPQWRKIKHSNAGKWWVPENINNKDFSEFIDLWLNDWLGYVSETVFDINILQINHRTMLVNNYNREMFDFLKQHHIEPVICAFRHRFFWDGGLHCITNDLYRQGDRERYD